MKTTKISALAKAKVDKRELVLTDSDSGSDAVAEDVVEVEDRVVRPGPNWFAVGEGDELVVRTKRGVVVATAESSSSFGELPLLWWQVSNVEFRTLARDRT